MHQDWTQELPRGDWQPFFDDLSRKLGTVEATVEVDGQDIGAQITAEKLIVTGMSYDGKDDVLVIGIDAPGGPREDLERLVDHPEHIWADRLDGLMPMTFAIDDADGHKTLVRLERPPALPPA